MTAMDWRFFIWLCATVTTTQAIYLDLPNLGSKCVSEDIHNNVLVIVDYILISSHEDAYLQSGTTISVKVTSPSRNTLHRKENVTYGEIAFTSVESGNYLAYIFLGGTYYPDNHLTVSLEWRVGVTPKDWESVARKEKIQGVELGLRRLEGAIGVIHEKMIYLKIMEVEMREVSEKTKEMVAWFSITSLGVCIGASSVLQFWYLKLLFQKKKLI